MQVLEMLAPAVEVYSIDEAFLDLSGITNVVALEQFGQQIKATTAQWVGITVGVGMAPTKTLAKLANYATKKWPATGGVGHWSPAGPATAGNEYLHSAGSGRYVAHAAEKLRQEQQYCRVVLVFMRTSPFAGNELKYSHRAAVTLPLPRDIVAAVIKGLDLIWRPGYHYQKAGVMLLDFWPPGTYQPELFDSINERPKSQKLMQAMDAINHSGRGRVFLAAEGITQEWQMKRARLSPAYTTRIKKLPVVR